MNAGLQVNAGRLQGACRLCVITVLLMSLVPTPATARSCMRDIPLPPPPQPDVLASNVQALRFVRLPESQHVVIDGARYSQSGLYERKAPTAPRYSLDNDRDYSDFSASAISDDGRYVVLTRPVTSADFGELDDRSKSPGDVLEFYSEGRRIVQFPYTTFVSDADKVHERLGISCAPEPVFQWIKGHWFDARTNRYYIQTHEQVVFVFDITSGAVVARVAETGPTFHAHVERRDGTSLNLGRFGKCDSMLALMAETSGDPALGFTGFSGPAQDGQTQSIISVPFAEISRVDVTPGTGPEMDAATVERRDGGRTTLYMEHMYAFCGVDGGGTAVRVGLDELKSLSGLELVEADPEQAALAKSLEQEINDLVEKKKAKPNWTPLAPEAYFQFVFSELVDAVQAGDAGKVLQLLQSGGTPEVFVGTQSWPLFRAALGNHADVVRVLLDHGATFNTVGEYGENPLLAATFVGGHEAAKLLLDRGANVSIHAPSERQWGLSPLLNAAGRRAENDETTDRAPMALLLLEKGADTEVEGRGGETPLSLATSFRDIPLMNVLLEHGADVNHADLTGKTPLFVAIALDDPKVMRELLKRGADTNHVSKEGTTPIFEAKSVAALELLIQNGANPDFHAEYGSTVLSRWMTRPTEPELIDALLKAGVNVSLPARSHGPLGNAIQYRDIAMVKKLLRHGADVNILWPEGETPLSMAALGGPIELVRLVIEAGAEVKAKIGRFSAIEKLCFQPPLEVPVRPPGMTDETFDFHVERFHGRKEIASLLGRYYTPEELAALNCGAQTWLKEQLAATRSRESGDRSP